MGARLCWTPAPSFAQPQRLQAGGHQTCHVGGMAAAEYQDPDMPVPAELCGLVWPGEFSALG